ncbi:MAG: phosphatidate cytidylyltransferase [Alphaproteobacteria bacterium]|nr:phosphatidate cytidylyltransferase [Alphaproteobacteria bacterium]
MSSVPDLAVSAPPTAESGRTVKRSPISTDWITRPLFGILLAGAALWVTLLGGMPFVLFIAVGSAAGLREWHRLFSERYMFPAALTMIAMIAALLWQLYAVPMAGPFSQVISLACLLTGCLANLALGLWRQETPLSHAAGAFYIGLPAVTLLMLRQSMPHPTWLVVLLFLAVWATDTGALLSGNLIGGPKLAPALSPKKTWAGSIGGLICAAVVAAGLALIWRVQILPAVAFGCVTSLAAQMGDLFESLIKRRVGRKDSGGLIPGHGGVLDRIDSILFAAPVAAFLVLAIGFDPVAGLQP